MPGPLRIGGIKLKKWRVKRYRNIYSGWRARAGGLAEGKHGETITNILRSRCNPQIRYEISKRQLEEKDIILVHVEEGRDKPYFVRGRGPYIRAHATNRIMTRQEMDEIYRQKQSGYQGAY